MVKKNVPRLASLVKGKFPYSWSRDGQRQAGGYAASWMNLSRGQERSSSSRSSLITGPPSTLQKYQAFPLLPPRTSRAALAGLS